MNLSKMSFNKIKQYINSLEPKEKFKYIEQLKKDNRKTVLKFASKLERDHERLINERERLKNLWQIEEEIFNSGFNLVAGIDEAGRGPLAGPVVAAAVILPKHELILGINDSKKIPEGKREKLHKVIYEKAVDIGIGIVENTVIDEINILNATKLAMKKAINSLKIQPDFLLIDAVNLADINIRQKNIVKGDSKSISIAAASIIAKVTRDSIVKEYEKKYPDFGFESHKGYGTKQHYEAIAKFGITPFHRKSFLNISR
ncbi:MAG: ribonuclease [Candidatus Petromonas sp.]|jgi:ribonuclease HII|nr:ribonuclease [Candidatus Petromonas sp.]